MEKKLLFIKMFLLFAFYANAQVTINDTAGWLESAYVKWAPVSGADSYNVYYTGGGATNQKIDNPLIRSYGTYMRADILGLTTGNYTIKVVPVISGIEGAGSVTNTLTVKAHDRSGFAFSNGRVPGAYKADGTAKDGAVVLYITENTKNTVSLKVTGATTSPCVGLQNILDGFKKGKDTRPLIIRMIGQITDFSYMLNGDIVIENKNIASSYITLEGVGDDATADGWGIRIKNASNIEVRNIGTMNCNSDEGDNIGLQQGNEYTWVHHCDFFYGDAGSDADQVKGDGALDCKKSTYVTFSYNHFWDSGKSNLLGLSEGTTSGLYITYHHNWYDHSDSRHPRVRYYSAHVYNNYYDGNAKYGVGATLGSSVFVEANYYRNCKYPMLISMQGSDVYNESSQSNDYSNMPTFSKEDGGTIKAYNNYMTGQHRFVPYGDSNYPNSIVDFDAYVVTDKNNTISSNVVSYQGGHTYNNFDTNSSVMYSYTADSPETAQNNVTKYAGRIQNGDFKWTFNNSGDDASSDVNTELKAALVNYTTSLVSVQGEGTNVLVTGVSVAPTSASIVVGGTQQLSATISPTNASNKTVTWSSGNTSVATVSSSGLVTAVAEGSATITVKTTDGNKTATCNITVTNPTNVVTIYEGEDASIVSGVAESKNTGYSGSGYANTDNAAGNYVEWTVNASSAGTYALVFRYASISDRAATLTVNASAISSLPFTSTGSWTTWTNTSALNVSLIAGSNKVRLTATTSAGAANLDYLQVTSVSSSVSVASVAVSPTSSTITTANGTVQLSATVSPSNATDKSVTWTSNNTSVATVSSAGLVTGITNGTANIMVTTNDGGKTATSAITVNIGTTPPPSSGNEIHNFTESGKSSSFYSISGNLSTSKGTETYNALTLIQCLKIESATSISFTAAQTGTLTLVFNSTYNGAINVDGTTSSNASSGVLTITLAAGNHTLTKNASANLYYMSLSYGAGLKSAVAANEISEINSEREFKLYPNPATSLITIELNKEFAKGAVIQLYDNTGRLILNQKVQSTLQTIDVSALLKGMYIIKFANSNGSFTKHIVKQ